MDILESHFEFDLRVLVNTLGFSADSNISFGFRCVQGYIELNFFGVPAAVTMMRCMNFSEHFQADRPFGFVLSYVEGSGSVLFVGQVNDPNEISNDI